MQDCVKLKCVIALVVSRLNGSFGGICISLAENVLAIPTGHLAVLVRPKSGGDGFQIRNISPSSKIGRDDCLDMSRVSRDMYAV